MSTVSYRRNLYVHVFFVLLSAYGAEIIGLISNRCVLDTMRFIDLLLVLVFDGREALPKASSSSLPSTASPSGRMDGSGERSHRQLIDCIRSKDTDALIEAIDSGSKCLLLVPADTCHYTICTQSCLVYSTLMAKVAGTR